jgi:ABC-type multidrug transport system ATPase subunit
MVPLLQTTSLRVDVDGGPEVDGLDLETRGEKVLVLAGPRALFQAAAGLLRSRRGTILTAGMAPQAAIESAAVAAAPLDPPLPPRWRASEYVVWSARLAGLPRADAQAATVEALARLKLEAEARTAIRALSVPARRRLVVAGALATGAGTLLLEDPLRSLPDEAGRELARTLTRATSERHTLLFAAQASLVSPVALAADEVLIVDGRRVLGQGDPAEVAARGRVYAVRVHSRGVAFAEAAERRGLRVAGGGTRWTVELGSSCDLGDLLDVASTARAVILELSPVHHAFA